MKKKYETPRIYQIVSGFDPVDKNLLIFFLYDLYKDFYEMRK